MFSEWKPEMLRLRKHYILDGIHVFFYVLAGESVVAAVSGVWGVGSPWVSCIVMLGADTYVRQ